MSPDGDVREIAKGRGVGGDNGAVRGRCGGGDDEIVRSSRDALSTDRDQESGVGGSDIEVVAQDRNSRDDVVHERLAPGAVPAFGQLNSDAQFGHRDCGDGYIVFITDQLVEVVARPLRIDQERRIEEQPVQDRSSTSTS